MSSGVLMSFTGCVGCVMHDRNLSPVLFGSQVFDLTRDGQTHSEVITCRALVQQKRTAAAAAATVNKSANDKSSKAGASTVSRTASAKTAARGNSSAKENSPADKSTEGACTFK